MPTTPSRARRWLRDSKAVKRWSDLGVFYVQLVAKPSGRATQDVMIGVDPGKLYSGIAAQSVKATLFMAHLVLPFETVRKRMDQRRMMRRTRRGRRISRNVPFQLRNHRQNRFSNRRQSKLVPSIRANRQLELRVVKELSAILPVSKIVWEYVRADVDLTSGRKGARSGRGFSPVMVGQRWMIEQLSKIAPVATLFGWETATLRKHLVLVKSKDKAKQSPRSHAVDGVALAASEFVSYEAFQTRNTRGRQWTGSIALIEGLFKIIRRPPVCRRQLHLLQPAKGGKRRAYGGTTTRHGFRKGD
ncbi:MAG: RRXRR domain-containing protein, partial [Elainellaceae cyanobacterium]